MDLAHGDLKPVRSLTLFANGNPHFMQANVLIDDDGRAYLADFGLTRLAGDLSSSTTTSTTEGGFSVRWCPPELLDPERFRSTNSGPTKKSDIYSMAMTIYQVSFLEYGLGNSADIVLGFNGQSSILRLRRASGNAPNHGRRTTPKTDLRHHPRLH